MARPLVFEDQDGVPQTLVYEFYASPTAFQEVGIEREQGELGVVLSSMQLNEDKVLFFSKDETQRLYDYLGIQLHEWKTDQTDFYPPLQDKIEKEPND